MAARVPTISMLAPCETAGRAGTTHRLIGVHRQMLALQRQLVDAGDDDFSGVKFFNKELLS
jgi:hypothetical protein